MHGITTNTTAVQIRFSTFAEKVRTAGSNLESVTNCNSNNTLTGLKADKHEPEGALFLPFSSKVYCCCSRIQSILVKVDQRNHEAPSRVALLVQELHGPRHSLE